ncbi:hypothetical protein [Niallia taxi]|uniref:hypothetical protein n=1 Tax=Niallia taxi TaxID=2499688 RepID=UPI0030086264
MRIRESCVNSEDIKRECNSDYLLSYMQAGFGIMICKELKKEKVDYLGYIDFHCEYLGDDILISKVVIYESEEETRRLTSLFKGKILIDSYRDKIM